MTRSTAFSLTGNSAHEEPDPQDRSRKASDRGALRHLEGDLAAARAEYLAALADNPNNATAHNNLGFLLAQQGDLDGAIEHYEIALTIDPTRSMALANLGIARAAQGQIDQGIALLRQAVDSDASNTIAWENLAKLLMGAGQAAEAETAWRRVLAPADESSFCPGLGRVRNRRHHANYAPQPRIRSTRL